MNSFTTFQNHTNFVPVAKAYYHHKNIDSRSSHFVFAPFMWLHYIHVCMYMYIYIYLNNNSRDESFSRFTCWQIYGEYHSFSWFYGKVQQGKIQSFWKCFLLYVLVHCRMYCNFSTRKSMNFCIFHISTLDLYYELDSSGVNLSHD